MSMNYDLAPARPPLVGLGVDEHRFPPVNRAEAAAYIKRILANHDAEVEEDLPPRTAEILHRRQWLGHAS